ncbi:MAG: UDP-4-amino-4-deoxy-L-arabinose-oxoglutarate aminotransferase [Gammaproteobacteria bacterium RIFCSPHIGHO2_12_FULL_37_14]|nr:MAG: UDP-4-amino-4-deoxy-L-arabinose-oxoglutarate aminotransferase [Gammaproteobacteria bacterium RIFCSPHIGHO2_12_FULL_37_14]
MSLHPYISVVIPVHNEQEVLEQLYVRLTKAMDAIAKPYEIILTNDGSTDHSTKILRELYDRRPNHIRIIEFNGNFGQHMAIMAGFERVRGEIVITMDADLQNPPEEIAKLVSAMEAGHDVVNTYRENRQDSWWRLQVSKWHNQIRAWMMPKLIMKDEGCMLRAYHRRIVDLMVATGESTTFIPALALTYAANPVEVGIAHSERVAGTSSYNFYKLIRYNFDLIAGFSVFPLQLFTMLGVLISFCSFIFVIFLLLRRLIIGPEVEGVFTLFAIMFFLIGIVLLGLGVVGEYIGRIYQEVRKRPRFVISDVLEMPIEIQTNKDVYEVHSTQTVS